LVYAKKERRYFETAMLAILSRPGARDVLAPVAEAVTGVEVADREKKNKIEASDVCPRDLGDLLQEI
jgi:hypothetical protein